MVLADWRRYFAEFMEELRAALPDVELAHNAIWYAGPFDDPFIRRQIDAADFINLERGASDGGLKRGDGKFGFERFLAFVDLVHGRGKAVIMMDYGDSAQQREYGLAAWLLISSGRDLMSSDQLSWTAPRKLWAGYRLDLGPARGPRQAWRDLLRRDFECGLVLLNQPGWQRHTVNLPASYRRIDGQRVSRITLRGAEAAVLLDECATVGPAD
jgi:hypothetical protein